MRGGSRPGAGRKALHPKIRQRVGAICEEAFRVLATAQAARRMEEGSRRKRLRAELVKLESKRRRFKGNAPAWEIEKVSKAVDRIGRYFSEPIRRPKGHRAAIVAKTAREHGLTERMVTRCWVEHRARLKRLRVELDVSAIGAHGRR